MISGNLAEEGRLLLLSLFCGMLFMAIYDVLRVFRGVVRHSVLAVNIEDYLYWVFVGLRTFLFLFQKNEGMIRWYVIVGIGCGMILFFGGISRFTVPAGVCLIQKFTKTVEKIKKLF